MFGEDRNAMRKIFFDAWKKHQSAEKLDAMQTALVQIIGLHPEYHPLFESEDNLVRDFSPATGETNPFLHLSLHLAIQEQLSLQRPPELTELYRQLIEKYSDVHLAEHKIMECLSEMIWQAQRSPSMADERQYLACIRKELQKY